MTVGKARTTGHAVLRGLIAAMSSSSIWRAVSTSKRF
jgi:hypothetical protein